MELTILMPCLNEEATLGTCIMKALNTIKINNLDAEILVSDNGSTDNSIKIAEQLGARVISVEEKGYGSALRSGIENARGKFIIMADSDDSYDFNDFYKFVLKLREGDDLVMGNRFLGGIEKNAMPFLHKYLGNPVLSTIGKVFFKVKIGDFHCGFRGFNRQSMLDIQLSTTGMEFASEMVVKSSLNNHKISEISIKLYQDGRSRSPHLQTWNDGWRHLRFLLLYCPAWLFLYPGIFFSTVGMVVSIILLPQPFHLGFITFDVHTMLYSSFLILTGFQMISFYCFSTIYANRKQQKYASPGIFGLYTSYSLERALIVGVVIIGFGIILSIYAISQWTDRSFGDLSPSRMLRIIIPSITLLMLGIQVIFNSFFASMLRINR
ncbi:glycosyltransferase family 2 protein [Pedobacter sp. GR22-6]|uniref:glycosyltransferase family 2 protein n=1 Tax=Pedobacter sp. GR22-6 TaxID=3127957 RepID=UPI00307D2EFB